MAQTNCKVKVFQNATQVFMEIVHFGTTILIVELKTEMIYHLGGYSSTDQRIISIALGWLKRSFPYIRHSKNSGDIWLDTIETSKYYVEKKSNASYCICERKFLTIRKHGGIIKYFEEATYYNPMGMKLFD